MDSLSQAIPSWGAPTLQNFDVTNVEEGRRIGGSKRQFVRFYLHKFMKICADAVEKNPLTGAVKVLSTKAVPCEKEMVEIITPGDTNRYDGEVDDTHRAEFWAQYKNFRDNKGVPMGTPLEECSWIPASLILEMHYRGCKTLEQLADASDLFCNQIGSGHELREFAKQQVKVNHENKNLSLVTALQCQVAELKQQVKVLLDGQGQPVSAVQVEEPKSEDAPIEAGEMLVPQDSPLRRGPGRPRKVE